MHTRIANVVASSEAHEIIRRDAACAYAVADFGNGRSPGCWDKLRSALRPQGYSLEAVFDAAHGRRYMLFVYRDQADRSLCWDVLTTPRWRIACKDRPGEFWRSEIGWVTGALQASEFSADERLKLNLPIGGEWERA